MAMGCSTNAMIHLLAMARRAGHAEIGLEDFERASREVPVIGNVRPCGTTYLMEDFYYAGGIRALMERIRGPPRHSAPSPAAAARSARTSQARRCSTTTSSARSTTRSMPRARWRC